MTISISTLVDFHQYYQEVHSKSEGVYALVGVWVVRKSFLDQNRLQLVCLQFVRYHLNPSLNVSYK